MLDDVLARARDLRRLPPPAARQRIRQEAGLSQADFARAIGVSREAVSLWESGVRTPRPTHLRAYVELLDRLARESLT